MTTSAAAAPAASAPSTAIPSTLDTPAARSASTMPGASVLSACQRPSLRTSVLAAPSAPASGETVSATAMPTSLSGMVNDRPTHSGPRLATRSGSSVSAHSIAMYRQSRSPAAAYPELWITGESEWPTGLPATAARHIFAPARAASEAILPGGRDVAQVLVVVGGEGGVAFLVDAHEVEPVPLRRVDCGGERVLARVADGPRRQPGHPVRAVRVLGVGQLRRAQPVLARQPVELAPVVGTRVELQLHRLVEPVVHDPGDLAQVFRHARLALHQRRGDQDLERRDPFLLGDLGGRHSGVEGVGLGIQEAFDALDALLLVRTVEPEVGHAQRDRILGRCLQLG